MEWFYALDGKQNGPVSDTALDELLRSRAIDRNTLVWHNGLADWQPLEVARPSLPPPVPQPGLMTTSAPVGVCAECRRTLPQSEMVFLNRSWVCAQCKPVFLQRIKEGAAPEHVTGVVWRFKKQMVLRSETPLPDRCIRCNAPANGYRLKRQLYWHTPVLYILVIVSILIYVIVAVCVRKKALIHVGLCRDHQQQRFWFILGSWLAVFASFATIGLAISISSGILGLVGVVLFLAAAVVGVIKGRVVSAAKITNDLAWVNGVGPAFLAELPEWEG